MFLFLLPALLGDKGGKSFHIVPHGVQVLLGQILLATPEGGLKVFPEILLGIAFST